MGAGVSRITMEEATQPPAQVSCHSGSRERARGGYRLSRSYRYCSCCRFSTAQRSLPAVTELSLRSYEESGFDFLASERERRACVHVTSVASVSRVPRTSICRIESKEVSFHSSVPPRQKKVKMGEKENGAYLAHVGGGGLKWIAPPRLSLRLLPASPPPLKF